MAILTAAAVGLVCSRVAAQPCAYLGGSNKVYVLDTGTNTLVGEPISPAGTGRVSIAHDGGRLYALGPANNVSVIDTTTNSVVATVPVGGSPSDIALGAADQAVYITNRCGESTGSCTNSFFDPTGWQGTVSVVAAPPDAAAWFHVGYTPTALAITPDGGYAYVANACGGDVRCREGATVSFVDLATRTTLENLPVASRPRDIAITPDGSRAYVVSEGEHRHFWRGDSAAI